MSVLWSRQQTLKETFKEEGLEGCLEVAQNIEEEKECQSMFDKKKLWEEDIEKWCSDVGGRFDKADPIGDIRFDWIKFCILPGGHTVRFWNNGNENPPSRIAVNVYVKGGGEIDLGDLDKIGSDFLFDKTIFTKEGESMKMQNSAFSKNSLQGYLVPLEFNKHLKGQEGGSFRVVANIDNHRKDMLGLKTPLTPDEYKEYMELKPIERKLHREYREAWEKYKASYGSSERKKYDELQQKKYAEWIKVYDKIRDIFNAHETDYGGAQWENKIFNDGEWKVVAVNPIGGMEGSIYKFFVDLPGGSIPPKKPSLDTHAATLEIAPYSHLLNIPEESWEYEMRLKPDAIDFLITRGPYAGRYTTLKELKNTGIEHIRVKFPSGRVEEYELEDFFKE